METHKRKTHQLIKRFSSVAAAMIAAHSLSSGQVIITAPNITMKVINVDYTDSINIDLNDDNITDFRIFLRVLRTTLSSSTLTSQGQNYTTFRKTYLYRSYFIRAIDTRNGWIPVLVHTEYVRPLVSNTKIFKTANFKNINRDYNLYYIKYYSVSMFRKSTSKLGYFYKDTARFIGVKFYDAGGNNYVGWIKVKVNGDTSITVYKFAYEQTADTIVTGTKPYLLKATDSTTTEATIAVRPKFNGRLYYVVIDTTKPLPSAQQVFNGQDGNGDPAIIANNVAISNAPDTTFIQLTGLSPATKYVMCVAMKDVQDNEDIDVYTTEFTTKSGSLTNITPAAFQVKLYPNPAKDFIQIKGLNQLTKVEIYNTAGRKILATQTNEKVNITNLQPGIYILRIILNESVINKRFIKY